MSKDTFTEKLRKMETESVQVSCTLPGFDISDPRYISLKNGFEQIRRQEVERMYAEGLRIEEVKKETSRILESTKELKRKLESQSFELEKRRTELEKTQQDCKTVIALASQERLELARLIQAVAVLRHDLQVRNEEASTALADAYRRQQEAVKREVNLDRESARLELLDGSIKSREVNLQKLEKCLDVQKQEQEEREVRISSQEKILQHKIKSAEDKKRNYEVLARELRK